MSDPKIFSLPFTFDEVAQMLLQEAAARLELTGDVFGSLSVAAKPGHVRFIVILSDEATEEELQKYRESLIGPGHDCTSKGGDDALSP